jgi:dimethylargininase
MAKIALTREVSASIAHCELTHQTRVPIDLAAARAQHAAYERALADAGYRIVRLPATDEMPDSVFIEDVALVVDELGVMTRPGVESRRVEIAAVEDALRPYRRLAAIEPPGTLDGGDVMKIGTRLFVGVSTRTNREGIEQLRQLLTPYGYTVDAVTISGVLHLKSAVTAASDEVVVVNPRWVPRGVFDGYEQVEVDAREPMAANVLRLADRLIVASAFPRTAERLAARGFRLATVDASELAKAEGAVTCCSVIVDG